MKKPPNLSQRRSRPRSSSSTGSLPEAERVDIAEAASNAGRPQEARGAPEQEPTQYGRKKPLKRIRDMSSEESLIRKQRKEARIRELEQELQASEQLLKDYETSHLRLRDELEVVKARDESTVPRRVAEAKAAVMRQMLETYDNLERCIVASQEKPTIEALHEGVTLVQRQFMLHLVELGLASYDPLGEGFAEDGMEQVGVVPVANQERDGKVVNTVNPGYRVGSTVIRQAQVQVGRKFK